MHSLTILLLLCGLLGSSLALTCWNSVGFKALRDTNVREINSGVVAANDNHGGAGDHDAGVPRDHEQVLLQEVVPRHQLGGPLLQPRLLGHRAAARDRGQEGGCGWHHCCHRIIQYQLSMSPLSFCRVSVESTVTTSVQETTATQAEVLEPSQF